MAVTQDLFRALLICTLLASAGLAQAQELTPEELDLHCAKFDRTHQLLRRLNTEYVAILAIGFLQIGE
jgi:hypothetical protein